MLDVFCSYDFISIVEEVNTSLIEFMVIMLVINLSYGKQVKDKIETLKRLCSSDKNKTQLADFISHLISLSDLRVDESKMKLLLSSFKSNFLMKQIDDNKSLLIDKFYAGLTSIYKYVLFNQGYKFDVLDTEVKKNIP